MYGLCECGNIGTISFSRPNRGNRTACMCRECYEKSLKPFIGAIAREEVGTACKTKPTSSTYGFRVTDATPRGADYIKTHKLHPSRSRYHSDYNAKLNSTMKVLSFMAARLIPEGDVSVTGDFEVTFKYECCEGVVSKRYEIKTAPENWADFVRDSEADFLATIGLEHMACKYTGANSRKG